MRAHPAYSVARMNLPLRLLAGVASLWCSTASLSGAARAAPARADSGHARADSRAFDKAETKHAGQTLCVAGDAATIWWSPQEPRAGGPLRILALSETLRDGDLAVSAPDDRAAKALAHPPVIVRRGGPPWSVWTDLDKVAAGSYRIELRQGGKLVGCRTVRVLAADAAAPPPEGKGVWTSRLAWDRVTEDLYSAFVERLFDADPDKSVDFRPLHQALRDPTRNFLHDHLGLREDDASNRGAITATPDCADLPYFLRAYFAWKIGLPFGFRDCDRGTDARPPRCGEMASNEMAPEMGKDRGKNRSKDRLARVKSFFRQVTNHVQSGSARTALDDDNTDYYPVKVERSALRPGVIYADPYGHVLMIVKWIEQTAKQGGLLLAVDGQPDTSIGRKRFWEGTFLFTNQTRSAGPGWKAFRPVVAGAGGGAPQALTNHALGGAGALAAGHAPYSDEQAKLTTDEFYARMGKLINPAGLDAAQAYGETLDALVEQMKVRVGSVANGETYMRENKNPIVPMPEGAKIFETTGPWEDYATPSRDMRLIIAMNVLTGLPERVVRHPELYVLGGRRPEAARTELQKLHEQRIGERAIEYQRSDGSPFKITVADLLSRKTALEMAYNPNDCVEVRWGARDGSPEQSTCQRHAPADQRARMGEYRVWFRDAKRPPR
jgi:hypothetical protein